jgi:NADPH-dependent 2,4-dienoyl-CoA reductase/sulfur reductase-like enzyme
VEADWRLGAAATGLDRARRTVLVEGGEEVPYDRVIVATGTRARPWPGDAPPDGVHVLRTVDDALALRSALESGPERLVVVGAGFVGSEVAATATGLGVAVTLIDVAPHPVVPFGPEVGEIVAARHREAGVDVRTGTGVAGFEAGEAGCLSAVRLSDGTVVEAQHALVALGAVPNVEWLDGSGLEIDRGAVVCDATLTSVSDPDVLAAGDLVSWPHPLAAGERIRVEHWTTAAEQGQAAGRNALLAPDDRELYGSPPFFWSDQYDLKLQAAGVLGRADEMELLEQDVEGGRAIYAGASNGALVAVIAVNAVPRLGWYRQQLAAGARLADVRAAVDADEKALGAPPAV